MAVSRNFSSAEIPKNDEWWQEVQKKKKKKKRTWPQNPRGKQNKAYEAAEIVVTKMSFPSVYTYIEQGHLNNVDSKL